MIEAIKAYLTTKGPRERELEATLASLQAYRQRDPGFKRAITAFVEAEASGPDPIEGMPVEGRAKPG